MLVPIFRVFDLRMDLLVHLPLLWPLQCSELGRLVAELLSLGQRLLLPLHRRPPAPPDVRQDVLGV